MLVSVDQKTEDWPSRFKTDLIFLAVSRKVQPESRSSIIARPLILRLPRALQCGKHPLDQIKSVFAPPAAEKEIIHDLVQCDCREVRRAAP